MELRTVAGRAGRVPSLLLATWMVLALGDAPGYAQGPSVDINGPPGVSEGRGRFGRPLGAAGMSEADSSPGEQESRPVTGRAGPSVSRAPVGGLTPSTRASREEPMLIRPQVLEPAEVPQYGELELPGRPDAPRPAGNLTLELAIDQLLRQNLSLIALRHEISMAQADVLTASLRANPIFYADTQLQPYGHYARSNPGGPAQYDVNVTYPLDLSHKRQARTVVAEKARRVIEAQFQDAVRILIDNLYTAYVDVVAAEETLRYSRRSLEGLTQLFNLRRELFQRGQVREAEVEALRSQVGQAQLQVRAAEQAQEKTRRTLARLMNMPRSEAQSIRVQDPLRDDRERPQSAEELIQAALEARPDLVANRLAVGRADADIRLARANRFSDVYVLAQPYTLQDNRPYGLKSPTSWALGVTASLPIYNWNQGNIQRARINASQSRFELAAVERQVIDEVEDAVREFDLSREAMLRLEQETLPAAQRVRDSAFRQLEAGQVSAIEYLEARRDYNEVVRMYRDVLVRHRRSVLDLNTAVGVRVLP